MTGNISNRKQLAICCTSGHALVVADAVRLFGANEIAGFLDDLRPAQRGESFCGAKVLGGAEQFDELLEREVEHLFFAVGKCAARLKLANMSTASLLYYRKQ